MSISHERIVEQCSPILENAKYHDTSERHERVFLTAYQIYELLDKEGSTLCQELKDECKGDFRGEGAGSYDGQAKRIAQAFGRSRNPNIETQYIDTCFIEVGKRKPTGEDCGLFRLRE